MGSRLHGRARESSAGKLTSLRAAHTMELVPRPNKVLQVGMAAPAFDLQDPSGKRVRLEDLVSEGPLVLGFHRGTW